MTPTLLAAAHDATHLTPTLLAAARDAGHPTPTFLDAAHDAWHLTPALLAAAGDATHLAPTLLAAAGDATHVTPTLLAAAPDTGHMTTAFLAAAAAAAVTCLLFPAPADLRRLAPTKSTRPRPPRAHRLVAAVAACALLVLVNPPWGLFPAAVACYLIPRTLARLEPAATKRRRLAIANDLPLTIELLAACLRAGRPPQQALTTVATAIQGPLGDLLAEVAQRLTLGADPQDAWALLRTEPPCAAVARAIDRSLTSGAPLSRTLERLADDTRQAHHHAADQYARTIESRSALPLGLCFLPAFVLLSIIPTIADALVPYLTTMP